MHFFVGQSPRLSFFQFLISSRVVAARKEIKRVSERERKIPVQEIALPTRLGYST